MAYVVVQHMDPTRKAMPGELLQQSTVSRSSALPANLQVLADQLLLRAFSPLALLVNEGGAAADELALLHELHVHRVELDVQAEELSDSGGALKRQIQLYESAPAGRFTVDAGGTLLELNLTGAALLGHERDALLGQSLFDFFAPRSARKLRAVLAAAGEGQRRNALALQLNRPAREPRTVTGAINADPAGGAFVIALMAIEGSDWA